MKIAIAINIRFIIFLSIILISSNVIWSQKIDVDSLLTVAIKETNEYRNYESALKKTHLGMKLAPEYLDFYLLTGRIYQLTNVKDSARYYYNYVLDKNPAYKDTYTYLINMNLQEKKYDEAEILVDKAIENHPGEKTFRYKKLDVYQLQGEKSKSDAYLKELETLYPQDKELKLHSFISDSRFHSDRIGINYNITSFDRSGVGPWHFGSVQYIAQRYWGTAIARINYSNRYANGSSIIDGYQYEAEAYVFTSKNSYSHIGGAYSSDEIFPKLRLGYSFYHNFPKGWEGDIGIRYIDTRDTNFISGVIGIGKYLGSYWINLRSFLQYDVDSFYPAFTLTTRYYFDTRFDYLALILGYGTSPDERTTMGQIQQRIALDSYRIGGGYYRLFGKHYITGIQLTLNNQEYTPGKTQNETEIALMFQYQF